MTITLLELKPSQIKPHKANPRREVGDVDELAASIAEQGIVEPLIVVPDEGGYVAKDGVAVGSFVLIAGHRRLAAAKQAKAKTVPCVIRADLAQDPKGQIELMLVENLQRTDLSPVEEAEAYQMLLTFPGYTQKRIAEKTGRGLDTVRKRIKLAGLPKGALTKVHDGQIPLMHADALLSFQGDDAAFKRLVNVAGTEQFPRVLDELTRKQKAARAGERIRKKLADEGVRVLEGGRYDGGRTLDWLHGPKEVEAHRDCPGFAAIIDIGSWSGTAQPLYVCDQPALHGDDADPMGRQEADAARQAQAAALAGGHARPPCVAARPLPRRPERRARPRGAAPARPRQDRQPLQQGRQGDGRRAARRRRRRHEGPRPEGRPAGLAAVRAAARPGRQRRQRRCAGPAAQLVTDLVHEEVAHPARRLLRLHLVRGRAAGPRRPDRRA
jgi:ParB/RepB/Spo0J family partition protein